ncbi:MAG: alpha/beta hydrolase [Candidatus Eremiobacteraeota bacterium]|nr:alpha/beta hydrolase [Candidatus Eremiobacteraeota bacterium]
MRRLALLFVLAIVVVGLPARAVADCARQTFDVRESSAAYGQDLIYQTLDVYAPRAVQGEPLIVFVHGGGWIKGDKAQYAQLGRAFARCGVAFAAVNYRLAPAVTVQHQAADIAAAVQWLHAAAESEGYARHRLFLMGHSAGAELAAFTATDLQALSFANLSKKDISGVIAVDGAAYNPTLDAVLAHDPRYLWLDQVVFGTNMAEWKRYDIGRNLDGSEPPFLVVQGQNDHIVSASQPRLLVDQLRAAGDSVTYLEPERDHLTVLQNMISFQDDPIGLAITRFVSTGSLQSL